MRFAILTGIAGSQPHNQCDHRKNNYKGGEVAADSVGEGLDWGFGHLGFFDQIYDLSKGLEVNETRVNEMR